MTRVLLLLAGLLLATGCSAAPALDDEAVCPGAACTDDAQERLDAIAGLDRVTEVEQVSRSNRLDRGVLHAAVVAAEVADPDQAREVALAVLGELDTWPGQPSGTSEATVVADPPVAVTGTAREAEETPPYYEPCGSVACGEELGDLRDRLAAELKGVSGLTVEIDGAALRVSGRAEPEQATLAARGVLRVLDEEAVAFADRVEAEFGYRAPLEVTWRLDEGLACEQPPGEAMVSCEDDNSIPFPQ